MEKWWFGYITSEEANQKLLSSNLKSCFLVRGSGRSPSAFVVSLKKKRTRIKSERGEKEEGHIDHILMNFRSQALSRIRAAVRKIKKKKKLAPLPLNPGSLMSGNPHKSKYVTDDMIINSVRSVN